MSDGLEINPNTGEASFVSLRQPGWHSLGTVVDEALPLDENMEIAKLNRWNIGLVDVADGFPDLNFYKTKQLVVRDNPFTPGERDVLGVVGGRYTVFSNEELFRFCEELLHGAGTWETLGSILGGTKVFGCMTLDQDQFPDIVIDPQGAADAVKNYLMCSGAHDGTGSVLFGFTPTRVVCQNTLNIAVNGLKTKYSIKHTPGASAKREDAKRILGISLKGVEAWGAEANAMYQQSITDQQFYDLIGAVYTEPEADAEKGAHKKWENKVDALMSIYTGQTCTTIRGTAWGAFNAMTEHLDWGRKPRKGVDENVMIAAAGMDDVVTKAKEEIFYAVKDLLLV